MADNKKAKVKAQALVKKYDFREPPINVFSIARKEGLRIIYFQPNKKTEDVLAAFDKDSKAIYLNADLSPKRQAFIVAHELGHFILDHDPKHYGVLKDGSDFWNNLANKEKNSDIELEANAFAVELLVPEYLVKKAQREYHISNDDLGTIKRLFGIPGSVLDARLRV